MKKIFAALVLLGAMVGAMASNPIPVNMATYNFINVVNKTHADVHIRSEDENRFDTNVKPFSTAVLDDTQLSPNGDNVNVSATVSGLGTVDLAEVVLNTRSNPVFSYVNVLDNNYHVYIAFDFATNTIIVTELNKNSK